MKTFNRTSLPESIKYNGEIYVNDVEFTKNCKNMLGEIKLTSVPVVERLYNKKAIFVKVLSSNLKGKIDYFNKPYEPTKWLYTTKKG
jgi:hypothetical protein